MVDGCVMFEEIIVSVCVIGGLLVVLKWEYLLVGNVVWCVL